MAKLAEDMTPEGSRYQLLLSSPSGLSPSQVSVDFCKSHDRIPHPDPDLEDSIAQVWEQRTQGNSSLFNGQKFRYDGSYCVDDDDGTNEVPHVCLGLGLTDYRTFVGTNLSSLWERFLVTSQDDSVRCQHTSSPLGHYVFPGGHPEPMSVGIDDTHQLEKDVEAVEVLNKKVTQEMFDSIICEVVEETGIPASSLSAPLFIGISRRELNVRPAMFFFIKCSHHSDDIPRLYSAAEDGFESTQLHTVSMDELKMMTSRMPGCHHGGFALYELMIQRLKNTKEKSLIATQEDDT
ncbi:Nudix hydrolase 9 [Cardamine amara subsp. amara]|uniref:Nudix hydrolase 9 n=1 Tax=Cardamine amara subsp. amara TaxID=228776 RepID=A0ABD1B7V0_CARAN